MSTGGDLPANPPPAAPVAPAKTSGSAKPSVVCQARAKFDYTGQDSNELSFKEGDTIDVNSYHELFHMLDYSAIRRWLVGGFDKREDWASTFFLRGGDLDVLIINISILLLIDSARLNGAKGSLTTIHLDMSQCFRKEKPTRMR